MFSRSPVKTAKGGESKDKEKDKDKRKDKSKGKGKEKDKDQERDEDGHSGRDSAEHEKRASLPPRPTTSGTEDLLVTSRRQASEQYQKAQRAERAYRAKKESAMARYYCADAKKHFKTACAELKDGFHGLAKVIRAVPYLISENQARHRQEAEAKRRQRAIGIKKKLEERLAREAERAEQEDKDKDEAEAQDDGKDSAKKGAAKSK